MGIEQTLPAGVSRDRDAVAERRAALIDADGKPLLAPDAPVIGLALSGGGIRSATFCLGLLRALAKRGVLHRFDYLSTVSGGGYIGAMFGRLFHRGSGTARDVEAGLADDRSLLLWWLRNNGRFLLPSGGKDILQAFAGQCRSFVATQFEVMVVSMFLACAVVLPHAAYSWVLGPSSVPLVGVTLWWWLLPLPAAAALAASYGYWMLGMGPGGGFAVALLATVLGGYLAWLGFPSSTPLDGALLWVVRGVALVILPVVVGWLFATVSNRRRSQEESRVVYTKALAVSFGAAGIFLLLGGLDTGGWLLRNVFLAVLHGEWQFALPWGVGWTSLLVIIARAIAPLLSSKDRIAATGLPLEMLGNLIGMALVLLVTVFWLGVFQMILLPNDDTSLMGLPSAYLYLPVVVVAGLLFLLLTGNQLQQLNRSSLHYFYRSRLARTYLSVGNVAAAEGDAAGRFPASPLVETSRALSAATQRVTDLLPGDDVALSDYRPHTAGGPVHLINCCINQTTDDRTGMYNADRKGVSLTVGPLGVETGTQLPDVASPSPLEGTTLAEWVAISGAAVGSGMGSFTRPGVAAMTFLSGFRLGYWQRSLLANAARSRVGLAKYVSMLQEMFARFPGLNAPYWYLSDGGHFDNTGVYALLKRRLPLIVLADCGADPQYRFGDVENLVRKARIDHGALIEFVDPASQAAVAGPLAARFATPASMATDDGQACLSLARITYAEGLRGALLVVKPRVVSDLDLDIAGYGGRHPDFPQQSTLNQFFSEEEWEAYCALGLSLGGLIDASVLDAATSWAWQADVAPMPAPTPGPQAGDAPKAPRRLAAAIGTSLGAGAVLTSVLAGWQAWSDYQKHLDAQDAEFVRAAREASEAVSVADDGFTTEIKVRLDALRSFADRHNLSDEQEGTVRDIADRISPLCVHAATENLRNDCNNIAARWGSINVDVSSYWRDSLSSYSNWPTISTASVSASAVLVTEVRVPSEASSPPVDIEPMGTDQLLSEARKAMNEQRYLAPVGNNAFEFYLKALEREPGNPVATDSLREAFPFAASAAEQQINARNFNEAQREIDLLAKADPANYTVTILRSKLDAQRKLLDKEQQQALEQQRQQQLAADKAAADKAAADKLAAQQKAQPSEQKAQADAATTNATAAAEPAQPAAQQQVVSTDPVMTKYVQPRFPTQAQRTRTQGWVLVGYTVDTEGNVGGVQVVDAQPRHLFDREAVNAVERWKYKPATRNGTPVEAKLQKKIEFKL
jgi:TonB family protein